MKKSIFVVSIAAFLLLVSGYADEEYWKPKTGYTTPYPNSPWKSDELSKLEYQILYLLEADLDCRKALDSLSEEEGSTRNALSRSLDSMDEVLETLYAEAALHLEETPPAYLLTMMLYHHGRYVNSAMERWGPTIEKRETIDEEATSYVRSILTGKG